MPPFYVYFHRCFLPLQGFLHTAKVWTASCDKAFAFWICVWYSVYKLNVLSVYYVSVADGQPCGMPSSSVDLPDMSVPVSPFSLLPPVHLVSALQLPPQVELFDCPDQAAAAYILVVSGMDYNWLLGLVSFLVICPVCHRCLPWEFCLFSLVHHGCRFY